MPRPKTFDEDEVLERALEVFWRHGYEGASLPELTKAMGINRPSMYATFGNKEQLFHKAVARYTEKAGVHREAALAQPTARAVVQTLLASTVEHLSRRDTPRGCLTVQGALTCGKGTNEVSAVLIEHRHKADEKLRKRFARAKREGDLPADADPGDLARFVSTVIWGLAVRSTNGASKRELQRVADLALTPFLT
ncbi:TetR/AcrR family transcriptional regulator [Haliangium ochraceum]|uniref:Transcriptional regulator, TetR family n=1 Tax=Haliangium ochraceum (strain DSM 14365 / JCM 11303 / SMP-2) TaxID=502025 RepID=D0LWN6_HALO1|nr:TetR/AcrR family transcriptional regulator [Haliangium ochraceum]ACY17686.1 transcriptional regulator, TetR family [Haliangium ochraceum DSM 14365]